MPQYSITIGQLSSSIKSAIPDTPGIHTQLINPGNSKDVSINVMLLDINDDEQLSFVDGEDTMIIKK